MDSSRPPDYSLPPYDDDDVDDDMDAHTHPGGSAAVRLLTTRQDSEVDYGRPYVIPSDVIHHPTPISLSLSPPTASDAGASKQQKESFSAAMSATGKKSVNFGDLPPGYVREEGATQKPLSPARKPVGGRFKEHISIPFVEEQKERIKRTATVKLRKKPPKDVSVSDLPVIPEGVSPRRASLLLYKSNSVKAVNADARPLPHPIFSQPQPPKATYDPTAGKQDNTYSHPTQTSSRLTDRRPGSYQSSIISRRSSILEHAPTFPPPTESSYVPYQPSRENLQYRPSRESMSPTRPWTPTRQQTETFIRPASPIRPTPSYEPADINGSPRPGTPSSRYGGSPRRPLPPMPAPLFSGGARANASFVDDATVSIPLGADGEDDVFGHATSDLGDVRSRLQTRDSYLSAGGRSEMTLAEDEDYDDATDLDHADTATMSEKVQHYGPAPEGKQERRGVREPQMSRKEVQLINGELVLECKIPTILYSFLPRRDEVEFTHMRYTAVTCDPDDFVERGYKLRQNMGRTARETELFICVTMYNEDEYGFTRTMHAVMKNISHFCSRNKSRTWGEDGWKKIVVCVVSDGREKIHPRTLDALAAMGVYQHGIAKNYVNNKAVRSHVYEYTTQVSLDADLKFKGAEKGIVPCQMIFCLKERNQRKLNSHRWFFNAFGRALNPNVCILLDVGTRPGSNSLYHLWKAFDTDSNVAGACGEIKAMKGRWGVNLLNPLCLSPDTMVRTTNGDKSIRDIAVGDQLFDHEDRPVQCLAAEAIQTSRMMKVTYTGYNSFSKTSFTCTPDHIMTLVAYGVRPFRHTNTNRLTWWTRCDRTELEADAIEIKWDAAMHDLYTEYAEQLGRRPTDGEVRQYLKVITSTRVVPDSEDNDSQEVTETYQSPVLIKLLAKLKAMDVDVDDEDESVVLMLLQQHMENYLEHMIPEPEDIPDEDNDDLIVDLDANRKRKIGTISTLSSRVSDKTFRQSPFIKSSPVNSQQESQNEASQSTASTYASVLTETDHWEMFAPVRDKLAVRDARCKCQNLSCKGLRRVSFAFGTSEQADLALELLSGDHYRVVDPCAVQDMEVFTMTLEEYQATCTAPMTQHMSKLRLYRSPLRFQPYQGPVSPVPIDPYWLGFWLGDGTKNLAEITSSDREMEVYTQALVDRLNRDSLPPGKAPLKISKYLRPIGTTYVYKGKEIKATMDTYTLRVMSTVTGGRTHWNPVLDGLRELGLLGDKSGGIPDCYMNADENTRLAVLAGLIESDGWLYRGLNFYGFGQYTYEHKKLVEDARKLALSCGIQCTPFTERKSKDGHEPGWYFHMARGAEKFQPHLLIPRKRMTIPFTAAVNRDVRPFDVEDAGDGEYRLIEVSGQLFQLADRTVVHNCASQNFEYKMSNILDKPLESVFGYITVLPGALSAYRYHALQNDETGHGPLSQYFKGETLHGQHADVFTANMYLAEDRILCWELVAKRGERWVLKYVKGCTGETDVPDTVPEFISQRRRWLNGAFFAAVYSLVHFKQIWATDHTVARKVLLHIEFLYQFLQLLFTYFSLANFYLTFYFVAGGLADDRVDPFGHHLGLYIFTILRYTCVLLICTQFILSLGNRPQGAKKLYFASMVIYGIIMAYTTFACFWIVIRQLTHSDDSLAMGNNVFTNLIVSTASTVGLYFLMSFMYLDPWHMFTSSAQYFMLLPSYICTLQVYAFCNTHDVTWGTKGDNVMKTDLGGATSKNKGTVELEMPSEQLDIDSGYDEALRNLRDRVEVPCPPPSESQMQEDYYKSVRTYMVVIWMIANGILAMAASEAYGSSGIGDNFYLRFILWAVASLALFRAIGSTAFAVINVVNMVVEGRVRISMKSWGRNKPSWMGGWGDKISEVASDVKSRVSR